MVAMGQLGRRIVGLCTTGEPGDRVLVRLAEMPKSIYEFDGEKHGWLRVVGMTPWSPATARRGIGHI